MSELNEIDAQALATPSGGARRSLVALGCGALLGLALAGYGLFSNGGAGKDVNLPGEAVALVNGGLILKSDFRAQTEAVFDVPFEASTPVQRKEILDSMISEELLVQRGLEIGIPATGAEVREALVTAVNRQSATEVDAQPPTEQQLRAYHAANAGRYATMGRMQVHDLSLPLSQTVTADAARKVARLAAEDLRAGKSVADTALKYRLRANPNVGTEVQFDVAVARFLGPVLYAEALKLSAGQTSEPLLLENTIHLLHCVSRTPSAAQDFQTTRSAVLADYKRDDSLRIQKEYVRFLREKARVVVGSL